MASNVDFPHPEGPAIERYSPFRSSKWTWERACDSTSSVTDTLLTFSILMSGSELLSIFIAPVYESLIDLVQLYSIVCIVCRHVGEDNPVSNFKTVRHLYTVYCRFAKSYFDFVCKLTIRVDFEELDGRVLLSEHRPADLNDVVQLLELNIAVHTKVRLCTRRKRTLQRDVYGYGAVQNRWVDARNAAFDEAVRPAARQSRVDDCFLTDSHILDLRFRNLELCL